MNEKLQDLKIKTMHFAERYKYIVYPLYYIAIFVLLYILIYWVLIRTILDVDIQYNLEYSVFLRERTEGVTYLELLLTGVWTTIKISFISIIIAMGIGTVLAVFRLSRVTILDIFAKAYIELFRNTPLLVQIFLWYYASDVFMPTFFTDWFYQQTNIEFAYGMAALATYTGAFIAEEIRAGIQSIPKQQMEASRSGGLTFIQAMRYVILPQAFRIVIPPLISQSLNLTKNSSLVMAIGVLELMASSRFIFDETFRVFEALSVATLIYMSMSLIISLTINMYNKYFLRYITY
jgi:polar amino acid transport system permease protein